MDTVPTLAVPVSPPVRAREARVDVRTPLRVLAVLPAVPFPSNSGGLLRSLTQLRSLDAHFQLTVLALQRPLQDAEALRRSLTARVITVPFQAGGPEAMAAELGALTLGKPLFYARYAPRALARALEEALRKEPFDVVHFDHLHTAQLVPLVRKLQPRARVVLDQHNVEAQLVERMAPLAAPHLRLGLRWQARRLRKLETQIVREVDAVLACSSLDAAQFHKMGARCVEVVPNPATVDVHTTGRLPRRDIAYVGSFDWWPNIDAALVLAKDIWPRCEGKLPDARLMIVGRDPPEAILQLASPRVIVTGRVPSVGPYLDGARVAAVPLRAGSGTRLKILEAWAHGVPVVSTPLGAEGLPVRDGENVLLAEKPEHFARALLRVFEEPSLAAQLTEGALRSARAYHPARIGEQLAAFYRERLG
ncbi:MAG: glycosyltransferase [Deltaproteobacteria bacterium]|nr:glycosyltransferase [Deltaproteobacteria bacterium]